MSYCNFSIDFPVYFSATNFNLRYEEVELLISLNRAQLNLLIYIFNSQTVISSNELQFRGKKEMYRVIHIPYICNIH